MLLKRLSKLCFCVLCQENMRGSHPCERGRCSHSGPWPVSSEHSDSDQVSPQDTCLREKPLLQPLVPALVISPLEKKKRVAQASLSVPPAGLEDGTEPERPSVIHLSHSSTPSGCMSHASEGSPLPLSSPSSSRSPSPFSVSSEDCVAVPTQKTTAPEAEKQKPASLVALPESGVHAYQTLPWTTSSTNDYNEFYRRATLPPNKIRIPVPASRGSACWVPTASSFTKVVPRALDPWRPLTLQPLYKPHTPNSKRPGSTETFMKKMNFPDRKDKSKMVVPKPVPAQQYLMHQTGWPTFPYLLSGFERPRTEALEQMKAFPLQPVLLPTHLSIPSPQTHPTHPLHGPFPRPYEATLRPYPYSVPVWHPPAGYSMTTLQPY